MKPKPGGMFSGLFDQVECHLTFGSNNNMQNKSFTQLLSAMNDEDEDDQEVSGPSTSTGASGGSGSRASPKKALATEGLD